MQFRHVNFKLLNQVAGQTLDFHDTQHLLQNATVLRHAHGFPNQGNRHFKAHLTGHRHFDEIHMQKTAGNRMVLHFLQQCQA